MGREEIPGQDTVLASDVTRGFFRGAVTLLVLRCTRECGQGHGNTMVALNLNGDMECRCLIYVGSQVNVSLQS